MITYESEQMFVQGFNKDVKVETEFSVNGKNFTAKYAGKNDSKQSIYSVTIDGENKKMNITQLKKRLGVSWTAERSNAGSDNTTKTTFADKSDDELLETAKKVATDLFATLDKAITICSKNGLVLSEMIEYHKNECLNSVIDATLATLKEKRDKAIQEKAEKAEKAEKEKAEKLQNKLKELMKLGLSKDDILSMIG